MKSKESHCRIEIEDMDFFVPDDNSYVSYKVYQDDKLLVYSVVTVTEEADPELCAEKRIKENMIQILSLPHADTLPEPLKRIVNAQFASTSGMLFLENDEDFHEDWTEDELRKLSAQIDQYGLKLYIEMPADPKDAFEIEKGEPVITVYCGLAEKFNFI